MGLPSGFVIVTFHLNEGSSDGFGSTYYKVNDDTYSIQIPKGSTLNLPDTDKNNEAGSDTFLGWYTQQGYKWGDSIPFTENTHLYAKFKNSLGDDDRKLIIGVITGQNGWYEKSTDYNDGHFNDSINYGSVEVSQNGVVIGRTKYANSKQDGLITLFLNTSQPYITIKAIPRAGECTFVKWVLEDGFGEDPYTTNGILEPAELLDKNIGNLPLNSDGSIIILYAVFDGNGSGMPKNVTQENINSVVATNGNYALMEDIELFGTWAPIGKDANNIPFSGTFDGRGHTINFNDVTITPAVHTNNYAGLFTQIGPAGKVKNLNLTGDIASSLNSGSLFIGAVAGFNNGTIINVKFNGTIKKDTSSALFYAGGIAGDNRDNGKIKNCVTTGQIGETGKNVYYGGGIVGKQSGGSGSSCQITYCWSNSKIYAEVGGGIAGEIGGSVIEHCVALNSEVYGRTSSAGRIVGLESGSFTLRYNYALSSVLVNDNRVDGGSVTNKNGANFTNSNANAWINSGGPNWSSVIGHSESSPWQIVDVPLGSPELKLWFEN